jgi:hypothetical protein
LEEKNAYSRFYLKFHPSKRPSSHRIGQQKHKKRRNSPALPKSRQVICFIQIV